MRCKYASLRRVLGGGGERIAQGSFWHWSRGKRSAVARERCEKDGFVCTKIDRVRGANLKNCGRGLKVAAMDTSGAQWHTRTQQPASSEF